MNGLAPRLLCVKLLLRTVQSGSYGNLALRSALDGSKLSPQDRALCTVLFQGTLERLITLDACIAAHAKRPPEKLDPQVLAVLRCGICELLTLRTPESAAVNLWAETVKRLHKTSAAGMVNAVLRGFLRAEKQIPLPADETAALSVQYSVPEPLVRQLLNDYEKQAVVQFLADSQGEPPVYLRRNPLRCTAEQLTEALAGLEPVPAVPDAYRYTGKGDLTQTQAFKAGWFHVQDLASQLCCLALDAQPGEIVLDVCAAPGGKSFTAAEHMNGTGQVFAYDLHENRVKLIRSGAKRLGLRNITAQTGDARQTDKPAADRVLCDVPCSGFGVMRRKPELRYKTQGSVSGLPVIQRDILEAAAKAVRPGGVLVYSTCTVARAENEQVVQDFLRAHPEFQPERPWQDSPALAPFAAEMTTLLPHMLGSDGFFVAKLRRASS